MSTQPDGGPAFPAKSSPSLGGIDVVPLWIQVQSVENNLKQAVEIAGEIIATCIVNLDSGRIRCDGESEFRQFLQTRLDIISQIKIATHPPC